jgi:microcystin-dependent protein
MDEPYIGEIRPVGFNYAPRGWMFCQGQILAIAQNQALFSLLGTTYGGNGQTTFALPDLRSRVPLSSGQGPGLGNYALGQLSGSENVTLLETQIPTHIHALTGTMMPDASTDNTSPVGEYIGTPGTLNQYSPGPKNTTMAANAVTGTVNPAGGSQPHSNLQPYLGTNYVIAIQGIFPSRS